MKMAARWRPRPSCVLYFFFFGAFFFLAVCGPGPSSKSIGRAAFRAFFLRVAIVTNLHWVCTVSAIQKRTIARDWLYQYAKT